MDSPDAPDTTDADAQHRLTAEELAFLLRDPALQARATERAERSNRNRTERRASDAAYAERLRAGDRERQRRRRRREAIGRPELPEEEAVPLPDLTLEQAAERLADHLDRCGTAQAAQLRGRPDRIAAYAEAFAVYRLLSGDGTRPTRGALAAVLKSRFARVATPSQVQKLRDHVEAFAAPGGPWSTVDAAKAKADTTSHAPDGDRRGKRPSRPR